MATTQRTSGILVHSLGYFAGLKNRPQDPPLEQADVGADGYEVGQEFKTRLDILNDADGLDSLFDVRD